MFLKNNWKLQPEIAMRNMSLATCTGFLFPTLRGKLQGKLHGVKSFQSALTHLLTTCGPRGTFSGLSTMRGCILIIALLQSTTVPSFWASLGEQRLRIRLGQKNFRGTLQVGQS